MKERKTAGSIDEYISQFPEDTKTALEAIRKTIKEEAPEAEECISYQIPTFKLHGNLVHFAAYEHHIGFYPGSSGVTFARDEFSEYKISKGTIQFPIDKPIPHALIKKVVSFRIAEQTLKKGRKH